MSIWFYISIILIIIIIILLIYLVIILTSIKEINNSFNSIIKSDTNKLISISSGNRYIKKLTNSINNNLKVLRKERIEYLNNNSKLKESITSISHDIRTPLTVINGYIDLLDTKNKKEYLKHIKNKVNDLTILTDKLFDFTMTIDNNINKEEVCINNLLEEALCNYYDIFRKKNITPVVNITSKKIIREVDILSIKRVFDNIISNALKYSKDFNIELKDNGNIIFSNTTDKIDIVSVNKIFDKYYTVESSSKKGGMGLYIAKELVLLNNGEISSEYKNNKLIIKIKL